MTSQHDRPTANLLGVPISRLTLEQVLDEAVRATETREKLLLTTANAHSMVVAQSDPGLREHYRHADVVLPDGVLPVWTSRLFEGKHIPARVAGPLFFERFVERANERGLSLYFMGSTEPILAQIEAQLRQRAPNVRVAGTFSPSFGGISEEENSRILDAIAEARPDALFVGMTQPRQELWLSRNFECLDVPVMMGIGAAFEFFAGTKWRPPEWLGRLGLEWAIRLVQEPRRLYRRNLLNFVYCYHVGRTHWRDVLRLR